MKLTVNGKVELLEEEITLKGFLLDRSIELDRVVVEYNYEVLDRKSWNEVILQEGDNLEILRFVGGGC